MADWTMKRNDTGPVITATLKDAAGAAVNLTTATQVKFKMRAVAPGSLKVDGTATVTNAAGGQVSYAWQAADTDTAGDYYAEWEVTFASGLIETFPNAGYITITIVADLP